MNRKTKFSKSLSTTNLNDNKQKKVLSRDDLILYIYKLKIHLDNLNTNKQINKLTLEKLKREEGNLEELIQDRFRSSDYKEYYPVKSDHVSLFSQEDKHMIMNEIENLKKIKKDYMDNLDINSEYRSSLLNMINNEKLNLARLNEKIIRTKEYLANIKLSKVNINQNEEENVKRSLNLEKTSNNLKSEIERMHSLIIMQSNHVDSLVNSINKKKIDMKKEKENVKDKSKMYEVETKQKKEEIRCKILQMEKLKTSKINKENFFIKIVLGLDIIQKFLLNSFDMDPNEATKMLYESEEYTVFRSEKYIICEENSTRNNTPQRPKLTGNTEEIKSKVNLSQIKKKFENLCLSYEDIINLYSKILNKQTFYQNIMVQYNFKQIKLESIRENYSQRIHNLLLKDYKNLDEFIKSNSRVETMMTKFQYLKYALQKHKKTYTFEEFEVDNKDFYEKCSKLIYEVKSFFEFINQSIDIKAINEFPDNIAIRISEFVQQIKDYFKIISVVENKSKDDYIKHVIEDLDKSLTKDKESKKVVKSDFKKKTKIINEENKVDLFIEFKSFYQSEKESFDCINLDLQKTNYFNFLQSDIIDNIIQNLISLIKIISLSKRKASTIQLFNEDEPISFIRSVNIASRRRSIIYKGMKNNESSDVDDDDLGEDNQRGKKKVEKSKNNKLNSFLQKMYEPYVEKKNFLRSLNENVGNIKKNTRQSITDNFKLNKKQGDIDKLSNELILYNNPKINLNVLSNNTYNSFVKYIISNQLELSKNKSVEDRSKKVKR